MTISRRTFFSAAAMAGAGALAGRNLFAASTAPLIGLQLYSVRTPLAKDFAGTLKQVGAIGYRQVEAAGFFGHSASDVKQMMADTGLDCISAHYALADLLKSTDDIIGYAKALGLEYVVCSSPWAKDAARLENYPGGSWQGIQHAMTLDDWKWSGEQLNKIGQKMRAAGLKLGYHNHTMGFREQNGSTGYAVLLAETDPGLVTMELDCGWAFAAGHDPAEMLRRHRGRFSMLHIKDLKPAPVGTEPGARISTEIGAGVIDYGPIFKTAEATGIKHYFVEQEEFDGPVFEGIKVDYRNSNILARGGRLHRRAG